MLSVIRGKYAIPLAWLTQKGKKNISLKLGMLIWLLWLLP
jgi:hypothetical protein